MFRLEPQRGQWRTKASCVAHALLVIWVPGCTIAAWWQVTVAMGGNGLAYLYAVEWPVFAVFGIVMWWNFIHDDPAAPRRAERRPGRVRDEARARMAAADGDEEWRAYNDYLGSLARANKAKTWRGR